MTKPVEPAELLRVVAGLVRYMDRQATAGDRATALGRADAFLKFEKVLGAQGVREALRFLNSRTPHRFTGLYRFDAAWRRSLHLVDSYAPDVRRGEDAPGDESYCAIVGREGRAFVTDDARLDERLHAHPAREAVASYCGVLLRAEGGEPFGTLCHFDAVPCAVPVAEVPFMEAAAPYLLRALAPSRADA